MGLGDAAQAGVGEPQQVDHGDDHHEPLEGVRVHHRLEPAGDDIGRRDQGEDQQGHLEVHPELGGGEDGAAGHDRRRVQRHEEEDERPGEDLDALALVARPEQFREGVGAQVVAQAPGRLPQHGEGEQDADADVDEGEPHQAHAEEPGDPAEADDGRGGDEGRPVGDCHDDRVGRAPPHQEVRRRAGPAVAEPAEIAGGQQVADDDDDVDPAHRGVFRHEPIPLRFLMALRMLSPFARRAQNTPVYSGPA